MFFDLYCPRRGWLHTLDPRTKFGVALLGTLLFITQSDVCILLGVLFMQHLILFSGRIPLARITWVWRQLFRLLLFIMLVWPWFAERGGQTWLTLGPLALTTAGIADATAIALRIVGMSLWVFFILFTTRQSHLVQGMVRLGLPFEWGLVLAIALRYIPTFFFTIQHIRDAQAARAWAPRGNIIERLRGMIPLLVAFIVNVIRTGDTLAMALATRGVGRNTPRTSRIRLHMRWRDWSVLACSTALTILILML